MRPMLATPGTALPTGLGWTHEVKWDGMRVLAEVDRTSVLGGLRLTSRNENDVTASYPELHGLAGLGHDLLLDAEVVALGDGVPSFAALAERMHVRNPRRAAALATTNPVTLLVFDLLRLDGRDLDREPLSVRREVLAGLDLADVSWQVPAAYDDGPMLMEATAQQGLEGVVSKRLSSRYDFGARSRHWLKFPHRPQVSYVIGGWRPETDSAERLGAVLVGETTTAGLVYRGRVGSGIAGRAGVRLRELLEPLAASGSPFTDPVPKVDAVGTRWVEPVVVVDVQSLGVTGAGRLRQPSYRGIRTDLSPDDLTRADLSPAELPPAELLAGDSDA